MLTSQTTLTARPDVIHTALANGELVLLDVNARRYYSLNETGARIWELLAAGKTIAEIASHLVERYEVTGTGAETSVKRVAADLVSQNLVTAHEPQQQQ